MNRQQRNAAEAHLRETNKRYPTQLIPLPKDRWPKPDIVKLPSEVWRSTDYLVCIYPEADDVERISVCRTALNAAGDRWEDNISWDDLQRLKYECGRGPKTAVEIYPPQKSVVNVANMRHLWVLPYRMAFEWKREE